MRSCSELDFNNRSCLLTIMKFRPVASVHYLVKSALYVKVFNSAYCFSKLVTTAFVMSFRLSVHVMLIAIVGYLNSTFEINMCFKSQ